MQNATLHVKRPNPQNATEQTKITATNTSETDRAKRLYFLNGCPIDHIDQRLTQTSHQHIHNGREQWMSWDGSFVLTDINALPPGGQAHTTHFNEPQLAIFFVADGGAACPRQTAVFGQMQDMISESTSPSQKIISVYGGDVLYPNGPSNLSKSERARTLVGMQVCQTIAQQTPFYLVTGNHEYGDEHAASDPYALAEIAKNDLGMRIPGRYYSEKFENNQMVVHILALDTSTVAIDATQQKWATAQALQHQENKNNESRDSKKHWLVVFTHHPPFSYGEHGLQGENHYLLPLLQTVYEQADLLVCGHEHDAQYLQAKPRVKNASASKNKSMQHPTANPDSIDLDDHQLPPTLIVGTSCESRTVKSGPYSAFHSLQPAFGRIVITGDTITSEIVGAPSADRTDRTLLFAETIRDASRSRQTENTTPV